MSKPPASLTSGDPVAWKLKLKRRILSFCHDGQRSRQVYAIPLLLLAGENQGLQLQAVRAYSRACINGTMAMTKIEVMELREHLTRPTANLRPDYSGQEFGLDQEMRAGR